MSSVSFNADNDPKVKLANFEEKAKATFKDVMLKQNCELFVQLKNEKWQGEFVDLTPSAYNQSVVSDEMY